MPINYSISGSRRPTSNSRLRRKSALARASKEESTNDVGRLGQTVFFFLLHLSTLTFSSFSSFFSISFLPPPQWSFHLRFARKINFIATALANLRRTGIACCASMKRLLGRDRQIAKGKRERGWIFYETNVRTFSCGFCWKNREEILYVTSATVRFQIRFSIKRYSQGCFIFCLFVCFIWTKETETSTPKDYSLSFL